VCGVIVCVCVRENEREREKLCVCVCSVSVFVDYALSAVAAPSFLALFTCQTTLRAVASLPPCCCEREREKESIRNDIRQRVCPGTIIITTAFDMTGDGDGMGNRGSNSTCPGWTLSRVPSACRFPFHTFLGS
jgi:hypothetical protein